MKTLLLSMLIGVSLYCLATVLVIAICGIGSYSRMVSAVVGASTGVIGTKIAKRILRK